MLISDLVYIDATGYNYPDYPTVLAFMQAQYQSIYGADVYLGADSQDGQAVAIESQALFDTMALGAMIYNSFNPNGATGAGLSRLTKLNGVTRQIATNSTVDLLIGGTVGTTIGTTANPGIVVDTLNQQWILPASVVIPSSGSITVTATAANVGAVSALAGTVNSIFTPTQGWQTVTNTTAATLGVAIESDAALRIRRESSTSIPSLTVFSGTMGAIENLTGVTDSRGYENPTSVTDTNGIPAHNIAVVVAGGDAVAVAQTIALHKTPGTGTFGTTTENIFDSRGMPLAIQYSRPSQVEITVQIQIAALTGYSSVYSSIIQQAAVDFINANGIGNNLLVTKLMVAVNLPGLAAGLTFDILNLKIARHGGTTAFQNLGMAWNETTVATLSDVTVTVSS